MATAKYNRKTGKISRVASLYRKSPKRCSLVDPINILVLLIVLLLVISICMYDIQLLVFSATKISDML